MSDWQPIETAPKDGTRILLAKAKSGYVTMARWAESFSGNHYASEEPGWLNEATQNRMIDPTHWMDLPWPPPVKTPTP